MPEAPLSPHDVAPDREAALDVPQPGCLPQDEVCNGRDDDCDRLIDDGLTPVPCPGGGSRYCVGGRLSECPRRCDLCLPGGRRVCYLSYCTFWAYQSCAPDGRSFGACRESPAPHECALIARSKQKSPELERCCIDNGYCCLDEFDLDEDGDRGEMLGRCSGVACAP